jgi:hypothetical protein
MVALTPAAMELRAAPTSGDVLISKLSARVEHQVAIVPAQTGPVCPNETLAIAAATQLALERQVDAWLTQDHTHYVRIACQRPGVMR